MWLFLLAACTFNELYGPFEMTELRVTDSGTTHTADDAGFIDFQGTFWYAWNRVYAGNGEFVTVLDPPILSGGVSSSNLNPRRA